jgi:hypothetical protein
MAAKRLPNITCGDVECEGLRAIGSNIQDEEGGVPGNHSRCDANEGKNVYLQTQYHAENPAEVTGRTLRCRDRDKDKVIDKPDTAATGYHQCLLVPSM